MRYHKILFDLDGTLTDSGEGIMNSGRYALRQLGIEPPDDQKMRIMVGPPLRTSFPLFGVPEDKVDEAIRLYREDYNYGNGKYQNSVYPGIENMLQSLRSAGCALYVATSKPEGLAREILTGFHLDRYFELIAGAALDRSRENKGDVLRYLLDQIGKDSDTVMVGDTKLDVIGAGEQGLPCIGVRWGYGPEEELTAAGAQTTVGSPEELTAYLTGQA